MSAGTPARTGGAVSLTLTICVEEEDRPQRSVAVHVR